MVASQYQLPTRISVAADLSKYDAPIGSRIWVEETACPWEAFPTSGVTTGGVSGPSDITPITWVQMRAAEVPHVYGNYGVARRLLDSLTPEKKVTLIQCGDSRAAQQGTERNLETYGYGVPWGGFILQPNGLAAGGATWTNTVTATANTAVASPIGTYVGRVSPNGINDTAFSAGTVPGGSNNRFQYSATLDMSTLLAAVGQFTGRVPTVRTLVRKGADGYTVNDLHQVIYSVFGTNLGDTLFSTYSATELTAMVSTSAATWDWATMPVLSTNLQATAGATLRNNEHCYMLFSPWVESDIGVTHYNCSVAGRTIDHFLNSDIFSPNLWTEFFSNMSGQKILWLSLGTNGVGSVWADVDSFLVKAKQMIALFRAAVPNGLVLVDSAYASSTDRGLRGGRRKALLQLCKQDPLVMYIDTAGALGGYETMRVSNYFGAGGTSDGTHFDGTTGRPLFASVISELIANAGAAA